MYRESNTTVLSLYACYWHVVKILCCGSVLREMICKIVSSMSVKLSEKITGKKCLPVFYHVNYLPFDQCFPSLWTLLVFCETKKIYKIVKNQNQRKTRMPPPCGSSQQCSLLPAAIDCSCLLHAVTEAASMKVAPLKRTCPFLQAVFPKVGKREWVLGTDSLEELSHLQSRDWGSPSHPWCVRASGVSEKACCIQVSFCMGWKDVAL